MSTYLGMQPNSYCTQCGAPMYLIFDRMCPSCNCSGPAMSAYSAEATAGTEPQVTYEGQCPHCGGSMYRNARGSLHSCGMSIPISERDTAIDLPALTTRTSNFEEITPDRARRVWVCVNDAISLHQDDCQECKRLSDIELMCVEQMRLWQSLRFWQKHIAEEEATE